MKLDRSTLSSRLRRAPVVVALIAGIAAGYLAVQLGPGGGRQVYVSHLEGVMGTSLEIRVEADSPRAAGRAEDMALDEIARLSKILSGYDPASEFSRWMRAAAVPTKVSPELVEVLAAFDDWRDRTAGALDPSTEAFSALWRNAAHEQRLPTSAELRNTLMRVSQRHWIADSAASTATRTSDVPLLLNSFTKSYIVDRAARRALTVGGVSGILLNAGGDVIVRGDWTETVGVADPVASADNAEPLAQLAVHDAVVATSGGYKRGFDIGGQHFSHVIDPRTGQPVGHVLSATVVSADAIQAGALATALCVMTPGEGVALARSLPGVEFALVLADGRRMESPGWRRLAVQPRARPFASPVQTLYAAEQAQWAAGWQLTISLELAQATSGRWRRPYVAVWIEDKDKFPLRTVALWYDGKSRFLPELRGWYRADRLRATAEGSQIVDTVTSATRTAGSYTLHWDGKDNAGKPVPAGTYTVWIEASREHGTYQIIQQPIDLSGKPIHIELPGGAEISAASLDYQRVAR
jgi:thiamine biosynthesis lipoprotein ApbE